MWTSMREWYSYGVMIQWGVEGLSLVTDQTDRSHSLPLASSLLFQLPGKRGWWRGLTHWSRAKGSEKLIDTSLPRRARLQLGPSNSSTECPQCDKKIREGVPRPSF